MLSSAQSEDSDMLWLLSSDAFPFQPLLMESQSTVQLHGRAWAMDEVPQNRTLTRLYRESFGNQQPPLAVVQHTQKPRKFVLLSANGTHVISKLRPADHLRRLLEDHGGPDNDVVRAFFALHSEVQATATALVLATSQAPQDSQVAEWATRAFFLYGGEPQLLFPQQAMRPPPPPPGQHHQPGTPGNPHASPFHPHLASTPAPGVLPHPHSTPHPMQFTPGGPAPPSQQQPPMMPEIHFSHRHNGLYLYFSRLIRPVWLATLVTPTSHDSTLHSNVSSDEADWIMMQLNDLRVFLEKNALYTSSMAADATAGGQLQGMGANPLQRSQQEALLRERQSLLFLQNLVSHCLQVMGLWKVVCDHQFSLVVAALHVEEQNMLRGMYFRDLMISAPGRELCNKLVQTVVDM